ncbi:MAG: mechanosensitive ion channel family protein [Oscillospiraceae bacterium]
MPKDVENAVTDATNVLTELKFGEFTLERILLLLAMAVLCIVAVKILLIFVDKAVTRLKVERSLHTFIKSSVRILLWFLVILVMADAVGIPVTSLVALFSVIGLAISLSIQGTLSNLAGGIMVLSSKPFKVGDYIEAGDTGATTGTVVDIGLVYTKLQTIDNKVIFLPNKDVSSGKIVNYTAQKWRRVDLIFSLSYEADVELVKQTLMTLLRQHPQPVLAPEPMVRVNAFQESSVDYVVRAWCATEDYWDLYFDLLEEGKAAFDKAGIEMTYNHLNVHLMQDIEMESPGGSPRKED